MKNLVNLKEEIEHWTKLENIDYILASFEYEGKEYLIDKKWFLENIHRINYDNGYGTEVINNNLKIVLKNGSWLERNTYDGSEIFILKTTPPKPNKIAKKDIAVLLHDKHMCTFNEAKIDGVSISSFCLKSGNYNIWLEKKGKIITEVHKYEKGNYKSEHKNLIKFL